MFEKEKTCMIEQINDFLGETKEFSDFNKKVIFLDTFFDKLKKSHQSIDNIDNIDNQSIKNLENAVIGLTYSFEYVNQDIVNLSSDEQSNLRAKLNRIGFSFLSFVKMYLPSNGLEYLTALHSVKTLINYDTTIIECLDFEIRTIGYRINKK